MILFISMSDYSKLNSIHFHYFKGYLLKNDTDSLESHLI